MQQIFKRKHGFFELFILLFLISIFNYLTYVIETDIPLHAQFIKSYTDGNLPFQVNFMYYFTVYAISFFSSDLNILLFVSIYVLAFITYYKYYVVKNIIYSEIVNFKKNHALIASLASFLIITCFSLPSILILQGKYYLANFPANIWHNSTIIFSMPFVVLLFWNSMKQISDYKLDRTYLIFFLLALNIAIKPSFILVFILAFPLINFIKHKFTKSFWISLIPVIFAIGLILLQYYYIYISAKNNIGDSSVKIDLFNVLNRWTNATNWYDTLLIVLSTILSSFLFPIVLLLKNKNLFKHDMIFYAVLCATISILIFYVLSENGDREFDGNFIWQTFMCSFLLFFVCVLQLLKLIFESKICWKAYRIEILFFSLHFFSGFYYFYRMFTQLTYA